MNSQWEEINFSEMVFFQEGPGLRSYQFKNSGIKIVNVTNIVNGELNLSNTTRYLDWDEFKTKYKHFAVEENDILMASSGATYGKTAIAKKHHLPLTMNTSVIRLHPKSDQILNRKFLQYFLQTQYFKNQIDKLVTGSAQPNFGPTHLKKVKIIKPKSILLQMLIASKLEELFTKLDAGIEYLKKNQILLKQYRQSVLKNAFEGKLTEKWRRENQNNCIQSISIFLENIFMKQNYELEIEQIKNDTEIYGIYEFPKEWTWVRIKNIAEKIQYGTSEKAIGDSNGMAVLRMGNIYDGKIIYDNLKYYPSNWSHLSEFLLEDGDVLFNRTNSAELVGKTAVYHSSYPKSVFASYLIRIKILKNYYNPMILSYFINSIYGRKFIKSVVSQQVGQANVNGTKLSLIPIPLMSLLEQSHIIEEIEKRISKIENTFKILESNIKYSLRLKSNILINAFEGKLVSQDQNDKSAGIFLERIKREQESIIPIKKEKSKITKKKSIDNDSRQMRLM